MVALPNRLFQLPNELLEQVAENLNDRSLNAFIQTCRRTTLLLNPKLYRRLISTGLGWRAVHRAVCTDNLPLLKTLHEVYQLDITVLKDFGSGMSFLHQAVAYNHTAIVEYLLDRCGLYVNAKSGSTGAANLFSPCTSCPETTITELSSGYHGLTPLGFAALYGSTEAMRVLIQYGAAIHGRHQVYGACDAHALSDHAPDYGFRVGSHPDTILHVAARHGHEECVELLLDFGADIDASSKTIHRKRTQSALTTALERGHISVAKHLIARNADPNMTTVHFETTLQLAITQCAGPDSNELIRLLLEAGAQLSHGSRAVGQNELRGAIEHGDGETLDLLIRAGASQGFLFRPATIINAVCCNNWKPLKYLAELGVDMDEHGALGWIARNVATHGYDTAVDFFMCIKTLLELEVDYRSEIELARRQGSYDASAILEKFVELFESGKMSTVEGFGEGIYELTEFPRRSRWIDFVI